MTREAAASLTGQTVTLTRRGEPTWRRTVTVKTIGRVGTDQWMLVGSDGVAYDIGSHEVVS